MSFLHEEMNPQLTINIAMLSLLSMVGNEAYEKLGKSQEVAVFICLAVLQHQF